MNTIFEMAKLTLESALRNAESALHAVLIPYGNFGIELNTRPDDLFSVMGEVKPNVFKKVLKVRSHTYEGLQMLVEGENEWRTLDVTDYKFLLDEVESAIDAMGDDE
jgi:hypothetical protein